MEKDVEGVDDMDMPYVYRLLDNPRFYTSGYKVKNAAMPEKCEIPQKSIHTPVNDHFLKVDRVYQLKYDAMKLHNFD